MAVENSVWGIDIGQCALKAMKVVEQKDGSLEVVAFEVIEHAGVLSQAGADIPLLIHTSLDEFLRRADVSDSKVCVSVLGQSSFTRFVKLPPVEKSKIPDIVRFEAEQQIPFPIAEVTWRYQTFQDEDSPEVEAGIFAMKQVDVTEMLAYYANAGLDVDIVQMAPLALYNFMLFDEQVSSEGATLLADIGADKTHLVVSDGKRIWTRTIQIGGNNFTEALVKAFKLPFPKAEKHKRTAASSKYARQIFQAMRPVFADLVQEVQRSIGYYTQLNRDSRFKQLIGMGNGFRLPGMQKYLEQNLNMPVHRVEEFRRLGAAPENFKDHVLSLGVAYGLCLQGLGRAAVRTNLLPDTIARRRLWGHKKPWFAAAAAALLVASGMYALRSYGDRSLLGAPQQRETLAKARQIVDKLEGWRQEQRSIQGSVEREEDLIRKHLQLRAYSRIWPAINSCIARSILQTMTTKLDLDILDKFPSADAQQAQTLASQVRSDQAILELVGMLPYSGEAKDGQDVPPLRQALLAKLAAKRREERQIIIPEQMISKYEPNLMETETAKDAGAAPPGGEAAPPGWGGGYQAGQSPSRGESRSRRGFKIELACRTPLTGLAADRRVAELKNALKKMIDDDPDLKVAGNIMHDYVKEQTSAAAAPAARPVMAVDPAMMRAAVPGAGGEGPAAPIIDPDPLFTGESMADDIRFVLTLKVEVVGDGLKVPEEEQKPSAEGPSAPDGAVRRLP